METLPKSTQFKNIKLKTIIYVFANTTHVVLDQTNQRLNVKLTQKWQTYPRQLYHGVEGRLNYPPQAFVFLVIFL